MTLSSLSCVELCFVHILASITHVSSLLIFLFCLLNIGMCFYHLKMRKKVCNTWSFLFSSPLLPSNTFLPLSYIHIPIIFKYLNLDLFIEKMCSVYLPGLVNLHTVLHSGYAFSSTFPPVVCRDSSSFMLCSAFAVFCCV